MLGYVAVATGMACWLLRNGPLPAIDLSAPARPLLHFIWPPPPHVVDALIEGMAARRAAAGVPGNAERHWRDEVRELERMARRRLVAERLGLHG